MRVINSEFYGDDVRWFMGVVEEVGTDKPRLGRVRVRIYGIHGNRNEIPTSDLPFAQVVVPTTEPGVSGLGRNPYLQNGATVFGIFLDGKSSQLPLVIGSIPVVETPSSEQINNSSRDADNQDAIERYTGAPLGGVAGVGTGGTASIQSALREGLDGYNIDPNGPAGQNTQIAWAFFKRTGKYSDVVIAGIIGNLLHESGTGSPKDINPGAVGDVGLRSASDKSIGIAQWYNGTARYDNLFKFAAEHGKSATDLMIQLAFIDHELSNYPEFKASELKKKTTIAEATIHFQRNYEIPAYVSPAANSPVDGKRMRLGETDRINYARKVYNLFTRTKPEGDVVA